MPSRVGVSCPSSRRSRADLDALRQARRFAGHRPQLSGRLLRPTIVGARQRRKARMRSKTRANASVVTAVLALAGCGGAAPSGTSPATTGPSSAAATAAPTPTELPASFGYLGATVAQFKAAHGGDSGPGAICTAVNACFGPSLVNDESV